MAGFVIIIKKDPCMKKAAVPATAHFTLFLGLVCFSLLLALRADGQSYQYPFQDPAVSLEERVNNVLSLLTRDEKLSLLKENQPAISRLGLGSFTFFCEGIHGLAWGPGGTYTGTQFPQAFGLGETWDPDVLQRMGAIVGLELRAIVNSGKGGLVLRTPNADLARDPRWGRTEEVYGEDPHLVGKLSAGLIKGMRGNAPDYIMAASMCKHFLANSNEADRGNSSSNFDQRLLREYYAGSFEIALMEGKAQSYMTAYNAVNGVHCIFNAVLKNMVRKDWGWDGAVCSDAGDLGSSSGYNGTAAKVAAAIKNANMVAFTDALGTAPADAISGGLMTIADVDTVIKQSMRVRIRLGELDPAAKVPYKSITGTPWTSDSAKAIAKLVTQKSIVLLKNTNNTLPLDKGAIKSIAIIGNMADSVCRDWYGGNAPYKIPARAGITAKVGTGVTINYAANNASGAAADAARSSDVAIVFIGNHPTCNAGWAQCPNKSEGKEAMDRSAITLETAQENMVQQVYAANHRTIVMLISSFPYAITWEKDSIPAILHMTHCSQETGSALADVLFGDYNPAGRLCQTWVRSLLDLPAMMDYNIRDGRTYMYFKGTPLFPFGYGLSYTTFSYSNLTTSANELCQGSITVSVDITNTGARAGEEVVQMYVKYPNSAITRPVKQLRGFKRIAIAPGATATVTMPLSYRDIAYWDSTQSKWAVEAGTVQILVGGSSADSDLKVSKEITACSGRVERIGEKPSTSPGGVTAEVLRFPAIVRRGPAFGISLSLKSKAAYDLGVFDLFGSRISHVKGPSVSEGHQFLSLGRTSLGPGPYMIYGRIGGKKISRVCMVR